jgi:hypothetical protein
LGLPPTEKGTTMCRSIHQLHNFEPPATAEEIHAAALQYVRKIAGSTRPSAANQEAFDQAVAAVQAATADLLAALVTTAAPKNREVEAAKARARAERRYAS